MQLSGISEWKWSGVWSQAAVDARWHEIGGPLPGPIMPPSLEGARKLAKSNGVKDARTGKPRPPTKIENDFVNYFMKVASDPYRKQSGISKVAGGVLQVASAVIPAFGYFQAVQAASEIATAKSRAAADAALAARVMAPALAAQKATDQADFEGQILKIKQLAPDLIKAPGTSPAALAQTAFANASAPPNKVAAPSMLPWFVIAGFAAGAVLILGKIK